MMDLPTLVHLAAFVVAFAVMAVSFLADSL